jgi:multidrug efflux pump subunit AcrA (membrane-fusion protein)
LEGTKIAAPIAGTILSVDISMGDTIRTEADTDTETVTGAVIVMADLNQLELEFYLDETDWELVAVGDQAEVTFTALPDQTIPGHVIQVDSELYQSNNTSVITGSVQLDSGLDSFELPIGSSASLDIIHAQVENAVLVPVEALHEIAPGQYAVYAVENGMLTQRAVEVGLQGQLYAEVKSGLKAGDVVSTGSVLGILN